MNLCRVCMGSKSLMRNICDPQYNNTKIYESISYCTGLQITQEDGLPQFICEPCFTNLTVAYQFKVTCLNSDEALRKNACKIEPDFKYEVVDDITFSEDEYIKVEIDTDGKTSPTKQYLEVPVKEKKVRLRTKKEEKISLNKEANGHGPKDESTICEFCGKVFQRRSSHYSHVLAHLPPRFCCEKCDYKTPHKYDLVKHIRTHSGLKQYQCEYCTASYYVVSNLKAHINRLHKKVKNFTCHICNHQFFARTKLNMHIDSHNEIKRHHCEVCGSNFTRNCYLKKHMLKHHGIEPVKVRPGRQKMDLEHCS